MLNERSTRAGMMFIARLILGCALVSVPHVFAQQVSVVACNTTVYPNDPDPKGTNIRKEASGKSPSLKLISDSESQIDVVGSSGDWLRIRQTRSVDGTVTFKGDGWVYARLMAVRARGATVLRTEAANTSAVAGKLADDEQVSILGCKGDWLHVKHKATTGWLAKSSQCGNPVTTCS